MMLAAGFECGHLGWCDQDLLHDTRHTPTTDMRAHYAAALALGVRTFRDGLPWRHDRSERVRAAPAPSRARIIWDLCHFDPPPNPTLHAARCASALSHRITPPHVLAVNEPSIWPMLCGRPLDEAVGTAVRMMDRFSVSRPDAVFYSNDPMHAVDDATFDSTDRLVDSGRISVVGVNFYPHCARVALSDVLVAAHRRYGLPVAITETGWHEGHENNGAYPEIHNRAGWFAHVKAEVERAGVPVEFICWYPWLDMPAWGDPGTDERWPCGWPGASDAAAPAG